MTTDTPVFHSLQLELGIDVQEILERPRWEAPAYDVNEVWARIERQPLPSPTKRTRQRRRS